MFIFVSNVSLFASHLITRYPPPPPFIFIRINVIRIFLIIYHINILYPPRHLQLAPDRVRIAFNSIGCIFARVRKVDLVESWTTFDERVRYGAHRWACHWDRPKSRQGGTDSIYIQCLESAPQTLCDDDAQRSRNVHER